ncbi:MAG: TIM barrel protein [Planctomycetes bacterium]|nr:TIM barrel protein [Planctomycetota bacterium]
MNRRGFMATSLAAGAVSLTGAMALGQTAAGRPGSGKFKMKYAPSLGMFRSLSGSDPVDQIKFMADEGFRAMFDNGIMNKSVDLQEKIVREMARQEMELGPFVLSANFQWKVFVTADKSAREGLAATMKKGVETAKRVNAKWALVVPGRYDERLAWEYQTANVIETLKYCVEILEPADLIMVLEPLNTIRDHPGLFLTKIPQAYQICKAIDSPYCKIVNDLYHQQITEGNLIPNIDAAWSEIGSFHLGDNPGRREPTTGEINYKNIFKHLYGKGYDGVLCMEHGKSGRGREGEQAVIDAYRQCDDFLEKSI